MNRLMARIPDRAWDAVEDVFFGCHQRVFAVAFGLGVVSGAALTALVWWLT